MITQLLSRFNLKETTNQSAFFDEKAQQWWQSQGHFKILHQITPLRMEYIQNQYGSLNEKRIADIGCGGGLTAEPLTRLGAKVTGIDLSPKSIDVAIAHAIQEDLSIDYRCQTVADLALQEEGGYDLVIAFEVIEHVADWPCFLQDCIKLLKPEGYLILSTLNRTAKSFVFGKVAAEYLLGLVPKGTHDWQCFVKPSEVAQILEQADCTVADVTGMFPDLKTRQFVLNKDKMAVNYFLTAKRSAL